MEFTFKAWELSNLLYWQVKLKQKPSVFWIKPLQGATVHAYEPVGEPADFQYFKYCRNS